jgi:hypothetical protein
MMIGGNMGPLLGCLFNTHNNADPSAQPQLAGEDEMVSKHRPTIQNQSEIIWIWRNLRLWLRISWFPLSFIATGPALVRAQADDYVVSNRGWNGLSELLVIARDAGIDVRTPQRIDLHAISPRDGVLIVYPSQPPPRPDLSAFMLEGGRLAIADDFGAGGALLLAFGVHRAAPVPSPSQHRLRGNLNLLIAKPGARHPLNANVLALVTNHPQALHHDELEAIFSLGGPQSAVVLSGAVGKGRLLAIGDSSMLINNMLELSGNRIFARNLIRYLAQSGRLWVATPTTELIGHYGSVTASDPLAGLRVGLRLLSQARLPDAAVRVTSSVIAALLLLGAATSLPRPSSYARAVSMPAAETLGGFAGRVRFFARDDRNLLTPLLAYKLELERRLLEGLGLSGQATLAELAQAMRESGIDESLVELARALIMELRELALAQDGPAGPPKIGARKFHAMLALGERILGAVDEKKAQGRRS